MAQVKGSMINAWRNFLKERYGDDKVAVAIQALDDDDRIPLESPILDSSWYPMTLQKIMGRLTRKLTPATETNLPLELGRYTADYIHTKIYRNLLEGNSNKAQAFAWFDDMLYKGLRTCVTESTGPTSYMIRYEYPDTKPTPGQCQSIKGYLIRQNELRGRKKATCVQQKCMAKGDDCCQFVIQWEA
jgi:hypothetical protein